MFSIYNTHSETDKITKIIISSITISMYLYINCPHLHILMTIKMLKYFTESDDVRCEVMYKTICTELEVSREIKQRQYATTNSFDNRMGYTYHKAEGKGEGV